MAHDDGEAFKVELESEGPEAVLSVALSGELDMDHATWVEDTLAAAAPHHRLLEIDLGQLTFLDSTGVRTLLTLRQRAEILNISTRIRNPSSAVARTLSAAELGGLLDNS